MTPLPRRLVAEALGTGLLLAVVVGSGIMAERLFPGAPGLMLLANALATGALLAVLILVFGPISGAHFNPVITALAAIRRDLGWRDAGLYIAVQIAAAIAGVWLAHAMFDAPILQVSTHVRSGPGQWVSEAVATAGLVLVVLTLSARKAAGTSFAVGLYILAAYWFTASTSFANPAVTIARGLTDSFSGIAPSSIPAFILAQLAGALIGFGLAKLMREPG